MSFSVLAILGPTASGKSNLAIEVANALGEDGIEAEIINADAMQLYRGMDIGTAKLTVSERQGVKHHLFDVIEPAEEMTAVEYQSLARQKIEEILAQGKLPILVGGSMFYVSSVLDNLDFAPTDPSVRSRLEKDAERLGPLAMHQKLKALDPITADRIPSQNVRRVVRALEVIEITGSEYSSSLPQPEFWKPTLQLGIEVDREVLKARIAERVAKMWRDGILLEAQQICADAALSRTAKVAIGYQQAIAQNSGVMSEKEAIDETIALTNRYARRQMSWFRRDKRTFWLDSTNDLLSQALQRIRLEK